MIDKAQSISCRVSAMRKRKNILLLLMLLGTLLGCKAGLPLVLPGNATPNSAESGNAVLSAAGFLEANQVTVSAEVQAPVLSISADQGQSVHDGQVLITLDDTLAQTQRAQAVAALQVAQTVLTQTLTGPRVNAVAAAQSGLERSHRAYLGALRAVTDTAALVANPPGLDAQIAQVQTQVALAEQAIQQARSDAQQAQALRDMNPAGTSGRDVQQFKLDAAQANLAAAKAQYDGAVEALTQLLHMRQFPAELVANWHAAQSQALVAAAQVSVANATLLTEEAGATKEQVMVSQADVQIAQANLALIDEQMSHYQIHSPLTGVVTSKLVQVGEVAKAGAPLLVVTDLSHVKLVVYMPVAEIGRVTVGMPARVTVNAYPGQVFDGVISTIGSKAEFTPSNVQTKEDRSKLVFAVTVRIPNPDLRLKAGMPADVTLGQ